MIIDRLAALRDHAINWNVTAAERASSYPCDRYAGADWIRLLRAIDIDAPAPVTFRWICQLTVAPYSWWCVS